MHANAADAQKNKKKPNPAAKPNAAAAAAPPSPPPTPTPSTSTTAAAAPPESNNKQGKAPSQQSQQQQQQQQQQVAQSSHSQSQQSAGKPPAGSPTVWDPSNYDYKPELAPTGGPRKKATNKPIPSKEESSTFSNKPPIPTVPPPAPPPPPAAVAAAPPESKPAKQAPPAAAPAAAPPAAPAPSPSSLNNIHNIPTYPPPKKLKQMMNGAEEGKGSLSIQLPADESKPGEAPQILQIELGTGGNGAPKQIPLTVNTASNETVSLNTNSASEGDSKENIKSPPHIEERHMEDKIKKIVYNVFRDISSKGKGRVKTRRHHKVRHHHLRHHTAKKKDDNPLFQTFAYFP